MQLVGKEKYGTEKREFEIEIYKDNNGDRVVIEVSEIVNGNRKPIPQLKGEFPMNGEFNLELKDYPGYSKELAAVKQSIILHVHMT